MPLTMTPARRPEETVFVEYQTFRGSDVREALSAVRNALGADALIGSTRRVHNGKAGAFGHTYVEIMAAPSQPGGSSTDRELPDQPARPQRQSRERFVQPRPSPRAVQDNLEQEIVRLKQLVDELSHGRSPREKAQAMLNGAGIEGTLAKDLAQGSTRAARAGRGALRSWLRNRLADRILVQPRILERNHAQLLACVGPTGVGKTTTLAKLAARAALDLGRNVHVISLDTFRVGAVEQWKRYSELIGIPFDVARDAEQFAAIMSNSYADLVLVDTAGRNAEDDEPSRRLMECLETAPGIHQEILLVLPAWLRASDAERIAEGYANPKPTAIVVTKLDETNEIGGVLHAALPGSTPVAYLCDGPKVPEDIRDAAVGTVVDAVLPKEE
jgi:flagellar biosynthesis protein FlhF